MTRKPTALILDFGGVLTTDLWDSIRACARSEGLPENTLLDLLRHHPQIHPQFVQLERGQTSQAEFETQLAAAAGICPDGLLKRMCAELRPDEAMLHAIATLRSAGVRVGVLSNSWGAGYFSPYQGYQLDQRADAVVLSDQVGLRKPEPAIFHQMLELLSVAASASVFVDDVAANLAPAKAMGMTVIHHVDTRRTLTRLEQIFTAGLEPAPIGPDGRPHKVRPKR